MGSYENKVAVITGAGRGIGRGIAIHCAQEGMKVVLAGFGIESITKTAADLNELGAETLIVQTDVSDLAQVENLAEKSYQEFGQVDLLVNNAGVALGRPLLENTIADWNWVMGVNFNGVLNGFLAFLPRMTVQKTESRIVNVSSISGTIPSKGSYGVSKHAVVALSESYYYALAETAPHVRITAYCPGWVSTELDTVERSRPERFKGSAVEISDEQRQGWRESLSGGYTIEKSAEIMFAGMAEGKLFIGPKAFAQQLDGIQDIIKQRGINIAEETNPTLD